MLITDNRVPLKSREMEEFLKRCNIRHVTTALYEPQGNGQVERFNHVLKDGVEWAQKSGWGWKNVLRERLWMYRSELFPFFERKGSYVQVMPMVDKDEDAWSRCHGS